MTEVLEGSSVLAIRQGGVVHVTGQIRLLKLNIVSEKSSPNKVAVKYENCNYSRHEARDYKNEPNNSGM